MSAQKTDDRCGQVMQSLIDTALEAFRFHRTFHQALVKVKPQDAKRYLGRADYFLSRIVRNLGDAGLSLGPLQEGEAYDPGMAVIVLNLDDFEPDEEPLVIDQIVEPIIMNSDGICRMGTVMLRRDQ